MALSIVVDALYPGDHFAAMGVGEQLLGRSPRRPTGRSFRALRPSPPLRAWMPSFVLVRGMAWEGRKGTAMSLVIAGIDPCSGATSIGNRRSQGHPSSRPLRSRPVVLLRAW